MKEGYIAQLRKSYPALSQEMLNNIISENLISPFVLELPSSLIQEAQSIITSLFEMRELPAYRVHYESLIEGHGLKDPGNKSIMMSYDFHVTVDNRLKLLEVNTNASFLALGYELYKLQKQSLPVPDFTLDEVRKSIEAEMQLQNKTVKESFKVAITDDQPSEQRLYIEFLVYQELFKSWGWDSRILDFRQLFENFSPDFIYNRHTDFFLTDPDSSLLRLKFLNREVCLSPNPYEYLLLADKQRMIDWHAAGFLDALGIENSRKEIILQAVPQSSDLNSQNSEQLWAGRKKYFFKPKNAFGSKYSYRGGSMSRKAFDGMIDQNVIAQEFVPAPELAFETPEGTQNFKYDLRCFAYQGRLQLIVARLYQGQVTNLRTPHGGFAPIRFV